MPGKFAILEGHLLGKNDLNSAITRGKKWENVYINRLPATVKPYHYVQYTQLVCSPVAYLGRVYKVSREGESRVYIGQTKKAIEDRFN